VAGSAATVIASELERAGFRTTVLSEAGGDVARSVASQGARDGAGLGVIVTLMVDDPSPIAEFGMVSVSCGLQIRVVDLGGGETLTSVVQRATGAGITPADASDSAVRRAAELASDALAASLDAGWPDRR
jgi:hypothetical protein